MKKFFAIVLALMMVLALVACGAKEETSDNKLVFGTSADYAPFEFMVADDSGNMQYAGIDVYVAQYIAASSGKELQIENMGFDYLLTSLGKGDYDFVIAAMEATEERKDAADFSDPYYTDYPAMILVKKDNADAYKALDDFNGKAVGAQTATTKEDIVKDDMPGAQLQSIQNVNDLVNQLVNDKLDAVVLDGSVALAFVASNDQLVVADASDELGSAEPYCIAVQKGDPKGLLPMINEAIAKMTQENKIAEFVETANIIVDSGEFEEYAPYEG